MARALHKPLLLSSCSMFVVLRVLFASMTVSQASCASSGPLREYLSIRCSRTLPSGSTLRGRFMCPTHWPVSSVQRCMARSTTWYKLVPNASRTILITTYSTTCSLQLYRTLHSCTTLPTLPIEEEDAPGTRSCYSRRPVRRMACMCACSSMSSCPCLANSLGRARRFGGVPGGFAGLTQLAAAS